MLIKLCSGVTLSRIATKYNKHKELYMAMEGVCCYPVSGDSLFSGKIQGIPSLLLPEIA